MTILLLLLACYGATQVFDRFGYLDLGTKKEGSGSPKENGEMKSARGKVGRERVGTGERKVKKGKRERKSRREFFLLPPLHSANLQLRPCCSLGFLTFQLRNLIRSDRLLLLTVC